MFGKNATQIKCKGADASARVVIAIKSLIFWMVIFELIFVSGLANASPQPVIMKPVNDTLICGDINGYVTILVIEANDSADVNSTIFEYSTDRVNWTAIGTDYDPYDEIQIFGGNTTNGIGFIGWLMKWNVTQLVEGQYHIRVTMNNNLGDNGTDQIQAYYDPTPPIPVNLSAVHGESCCITEIEVDVNDEDVAYVEFGYLDIILNTTTGWFTKENETHKFGDLKQRDVGDNANNGGNNFCGPTAAANCLHWFNKSYPNLLTDNLTYTAQILTDNNHMKTDRNSGTFNYNFESGLQRYINKRNVPLKVKHERTQFWIKDDKPISDVPKWNFLKTQFKGCENIIVLVSEWTGPGNDGKNGTSDDDYENGHYMTLSALNQTTKKVKFRDPANGQNTGEIQWNDRDDRPKPLNWKGDVVHEQIRYNNKWMCVLDIFAVSEESKKDPPIGTDTDGSDGWGISWNTCSIEEGYKLIIATAVDSNNNSVSGMIEVYATKCKDVPTITPLGLIVLILTLTLLASWAIKRK